jgi:hypothetical protein
MQATVLYCIVRYWLPPQVVDATQALYLSAEVLNSKVWRGISLNLRAISFKCAYEGADKSVPLGKYCLKRKLMFSFEPRCQGLCGS